MTTPIVAKVLLSGRNQSISLPRQFRLNTDEVYISKEDDRLIITPKLKKMTWKEFFAAGKPFADFDVERDSRPPRQVDL
ncbi:hypothetical protein FACS1894186_7780 [Alphaproteobacteria bacterium]|nr:hypothetical protein FACS1894186_7780 [Alphaproteobacteria bacterium]